MKPVPSYCYEGVIFLPVVQDITQIEEVKQEQAEIEAFFTIPENYGFVTEGSGWELNKQ